MQQYFSFDGVNTPQAKKLLKRLSLISTGYDKKEGYIESLGIKSKQYKGPYTPAEKALTAKVQQLEEEVLRISEERDAALEENRRRIDELNSALLSVKEGLEKLDRAKRRKEKRIILIEEKINETVKLNIPPH